MIPPEPQPGGNLLNMLSQLLGVFQQSSPGSAAGNISQQQAAYPGPAAAIFGGPPPSGQPLPFISHPMQTAGASLQSRQSMLRPHPLTPHQQAAVAALIAAWVHPRNLRFPFVPPTYPGGRF